MNHKAQAIFGLQKSDIFIVAIACVLLTLGPNTQAQQQLTPAALEALEARAESGDAESQYNLGVLYDNGGDFQQDFSEAAAWYRKAAEQGHYPSQSRLGYMYAHGQGVKKDRVQAYLWLSLASQHGIGTALNALESVVKSMSAEEKSMGATLFEQWRNKTGTDNVQVAIRPSPSS